MPSASWQVRRRALLLRSIAAGLGGCTVPLLWAEPGKAIRLIVPFTAGGSSDILARALVPKLSQALGQAVIIDNKPGAGGSLGAAEAAKAEPDGQTLLMGHLGTLAVNPALYPRLPYDPVKSFEPVAWVARVPNVLVVPAGFPARNLQEFVDWVHAHPGRLTYSSGGNGSAAHIIFEYLKLRARLFVVHVPYRGSGPSINDLLAGQVDCTFTGIPALLPHIKSGRLRALAVSSTTRLPALPEVPTVAESGYPGFEADQWYGVVAPKGTPATVVARLNAEINHALGSADVAQRLAAEGAQPMPSTPRVFGELIAREITRWAQVVKAGQVTAD